MTPQERATLKQELREEILDELYSETRRNCDAWQRVRNQFLKTLDMENGKRKNSLMSAFNTFIRERFDLKYVARLTEDQVDDALALIPKFMELAGLNNEM